MNLSFHHCDPHRGNESFLLRFEVDGSGRNPCILVDAGQGCTVGDHLKPNDDLAAILLTHAHRDHYQNLPECHREGVPVYCSPTTADLLPDVLDVARRDYGVGESDTLVEDLSPITDWETVAPGIEVHPLPAGHAPGALGFLLRVDDQSADRTLRVAITGDFTERRIGGYQGLSSADLLAVDVLFLTAATAEEFGEKLTAALGDAIEGVLEGGPTLVTASGLQGVQLTYLLGNLLDRFGIDATVRPVGQVAKHYDHVGYDTPNVEPLEVFDDPDTCVDSNVITVAGPEVPRERSSGRIFERLEQNPAATVVQVTGGGYDPIETEGCSISSHEVVNHPSEDLLEELVSATEPKQTVLTHHRGTDSEQFMGDWPSYVWATIDDDEHVLYADGEWQAPEWTDDATAMRARGNGETTVSTVGGLAGDLPLPAVGREPDVDLPAEGVRLGDLEDRVDELVGDEDTSRGATDQSAGTERATEQITANAATNNQTMADGNDTTERTVDSGAMFDTVSPDIDTEPTDEQIERIIDDDPKDIVSARARASLRSDSREAPDEDSADDNAGDDDGVDEAEAPTDRESVTAEVESSGGAESDTEPSEEGIENEDPQEADAEESQAGTEATIAETNPTDEETADISTSVSEHDVSEFDVGPTLATLARLSYQSERSASSLGAFGNSAVESYLAALVSDDGAKSVPIPETNTEARIDADPVLEALAERTIAERDDLDGVTDLILSAAAEVVDDDSGGNSIPVTDFEAYSSLVDAVVENDDYPSESRTDVVQAAIAHSLGIGGEEQG